MYNHSDSVFISTYFYDLTDNTCEYLGIKKTWLIFISPDINILKCHTILWSNRKTLTTIEVIIWSKRHQIMFPLYKGCQLLNCVWTETRRAR